jgi:acyl-CoA thioesterase-1
MSELFRYVALGDSTAVGVGADSGGGYPERIYQRLRGIGVNAGLLNLGQSGATAAQVLTHQLARRIPQANLVTLGVGSNDLWRLTPADDFSRTLEEIASRVAATGATVVVSTIIDLCNAPVARLFLPRMGIPPELITSRVNELNAALTEVARAHGFRLCDVHSLGQVELKESPDYFSADGFHPSSKGYARWAEVMWPEVEGALPR